MFCARHLRAATSTAATRGLPTRRAQAHPIAVRAERVGRARPATDGAGTQAASERTLVPFPGRRQIRSVRRVPRSEARGLGREHTGP